MDAARSPRRVVLRPGESARGLGTRWRSSARNLGEVIDYAKTYRACRRNRRMAVCDPGASSDGDCRSYVGPARLRRDRFLFPAGNQTGHQLFESWELSVLSQRSKF
jgi:hypothetical protein